MKPRLHIMVWALAALVLSACGSATASESKEFASGCWSQADTIRLDFENSDTSQAYQLVFPIRFDDDYKFRNIYLRLQVISPQGVAGDNAYNFDLMDEYGEWYTNFQGGGYKFRLDLPDAARLNQNGTYRFKLYHYMREERLCGISDVGIELVPLD